MNPVDQKLSDQELAALKASVLEQFKSIIHRPFKVSIIGQTGVGKSSLLNALFNLNLKTDAVKPCTKEIEEIPITNPQGHTLLFYDLPGIGESTEADEQYLQSYRTHLLESDVVLWAIHGDNRSVTFDLESLHKLMSSFDKAQHAQLMSKLTFVLTKTDLLYPPPWFLVEIEGGFAKFVPSKPVLEILEQKSAYYQEQFLRPYANLIVSHTFNDCKFNIAEGRLSFDESFVYYHGFLDSQTLSNLKGKYPNYSEVFDRLYDNYQVVPCSATLRFNLNKLMLVIVNKLGQDAIIRFRNFFEESHLDRLPIAQSKELFNIVIYGGDPTATGKPETRKGVPKDKGGSLFSVFGAAVGSGASVGIIGGPVVVAAIGAGLGSLIGDWLKKKNE